MDKSIIKKINIEVIVRIFAAFLALTFFLPVYSARDDEYGVSISPYDAALGGEINYNDTDDDPLKRADLSLKIGFFIPLVLSIFQLILGAAYPVLGMLVTLVNAAVAVYCRNIAEFYMLDELTKDSVFSPTVLYNAYIVISVAIIILLAAHMMKLPALVRELRARKAATNK